MEEKKLDLRIVKTQKSLCEAFTNMLVEKSFEDITVNELCDRAMVRRPTFYKHFADKYDFFAFYIRYTSDSFALNYKETDCNNSYYTYMFEHTLDFLEKNLTLLKSVQNSAVFSNLFMILSDEIQHNVYLALESQKEKGQLSELSLTILSNYIAGGISQLLKYWAKNRDTISKETLIKNYTAMQNSLAPFIE